MSADATCLVIGDAILDRSRFVTYERPSPEDLQCPVAIDERTEWVLGGAANVARWISGLGDVRRTSLIAHFSRNDKYADALAGGLYGAGITQCVHLSRPFGRGTVKERIYLQQENIHGCTWQQVIRIDSDTDMTLSAAEAESFYGNADMLFACQRPAIVVVADYGKGVFTGDYAPKLLLSLEELVERHQVPIVVNSKFPSRWRSFPADFLVCNEKEYGDVRDQPLATRHLIVTRAERGVCALIYAGTGWATHKEYAPTLATVVRDVTGAGDAFLAGLASHLVKTGYRRGQVLENGSLLAATQEGQATAGACVHQLGCGVPGRLEVGVTP